MQIEHHTLRPRIHESARVAPSAVLCGDVTIGARCSIGFGAVLTAESGPITIGEDCVVMDTAVLRGVHDNPLKIGNRVLVGPRAYLSGCEVEDNVFLATGTTVFNGAKIGTGQKCGSTEWSTYALYCRPIQRSPLGGLQWATRSRFFLNQHEQIWSLQKPLDFPLYVFGVPRPPEGESIMPTVMPRYAAVLRRHEKSNFRRASVQFVRADDTIAAFETVLGGSN